MENEAGDHSNKETLHLLLSRRQIEFKNSAERILKSNRHVFEQQKKLFDPGVTHEKLLEACEDLTPKDYDEVIIERNTDNLCGFPSCSEKISSSFKKTTNLSLCKEDIFGKKERRVYCGKRCMDASIKLRGQLCTEPLHFRTGRKELNFSLDHLHEQRIQSPPPLAPASALPPTPAPELPPTPQSPPPPSSSALQFDLSPFAKVWNLLTKCITDTTIDYLSNRPLNKSTCLPRSTTFAKDIFCKNLISGTKSILSQHNIDLDLSSDIIELVHTLFVNRIVADLSNVDLVKRQLCTIFLNLIATRHDPHIKQILTAFDSIALSSNLDSIQTQLLLSLASPKYRRHRPFSH